jgi:putative aldouronate transport system substrate-binding protein
VELIKTNPNARVVPLPYIIGPVSGKKLAMRDSGFNGAFLIPKKVPEAKLKKIMEFMDYGVSEEGSDLANYGLKGVHYNEKDGFKVSTEQAVKDIVAQQAFGQIFLKHDKYLRAFWPGIPVDQYQENKKIIDDRSQYSLPSPAVGLVSDTQIKAGKEYAKSIQDLKVKVIMGAVPMTAWDDTVNKLKADSQYQKITSEMNEAYQKRMKK